MMKNKRLEERRKKISKDVDIFVKQSFDIVDRIHEILVNQGKEQKDLAHLLGKSESEISKWMTGTHNFTLNTLAKIQSVLGESVIEVINEKRSANQFITYITYKGLEPNKPKKRSTPIGTKQYDPQDYSHFIYDLDKIGSLNKIVDSNLNKSIELPLYELFVINEKLFENSWEIINPKNKQYLDTSKKTSEVSTKMKLAVVNKSFQHSGY